MDRNGVFMDYKGLTIYEKNGVFTVGGPHNDAFDDCTLENLEYGPEEVDLVAYCRENSIPLQFDDLRGHVCDVPYEKYLEHLGKFETDPDGSFTDYEFIVPVVRCTSVEQARGLIDWIEERCREMTCPGIEGVILDATARSGGAGDMSKEPDKSLD